MTVSFRTARLLQAFEHAAEAYRLWGKPAGERYIQRVQYILDAPSVQALYDIRSLRLHPLSGPLAGRHAMVLVDRWRLILTIEGDTVTIEEVSNHYGD